MNTHALSRTAARAGAVLGVAAVAVIAGTTAASAHISTDPSEVSRGEYNRVSFQVPNESPTAGTVKVELTLPAEYPLTSVRTEPKPGWTAKITKQKLDKPVDVNNTTITEAVRTVSWTAEPSARIGPDQFGVFSILVSALPDNTDELVIPTTQAYDDGKVVKWDQPPAPDGEEPEFPAPILKLTGSVEHGHAASESGSGEEAASHDESEGEHAEAGAADADDDAARWLGGGGLLVGALALGIALGALLRSRRPIARTESADDDTK